MFDVLQEFGKVVLVMVLFLAICIVITEIWFWVRQEFVDWR